MGYLLDTVALLMWWTEQPRLGPHARSLLQDGEDAIHVSAISVWEIANKNRIGKLPMLDDFTIVFPRLVRENGFAILDLDYRHAMRAGYLAGAHRDPFDRLLAGQALVEDMTVLTNDVQFAGFGCKVLW